MNEVAGANPYSGLWGGIAQGIGSTFGAATSIYNIASGNAAEQASLAAEVEKNRIAAEQAAKTQRTKIIVTSIIVGGIIIFLIIRSINKNKNK